MTKRQYVAPTLELIKVLDAPTRKSKEALRGTTAVAPSPLPPEPPDNLKR